MSIFALKHKFYAMISQYRLYCIWPDSNTQTKKKCHTLFILTLFIVLFRCKIWGSCA